MRRGFALVFSLLLVLAFSVLATGMLAVGAREVWLADTTARKARVDRRAETVAIGALADWSTRAVLDLPVGGSREVARLPDATVRAERLDAGLFLLRAEAREPAPDGVTTGKVGLLVRVVSPGRVASAFPAALTTAGAARLSGGTVIGATASAPCDDPVPGVFGPDVSLGPAAMVSGDPPVRRDDPPPPPAPDPLGSGLAPAVATLQHGGRTARPRPLSVDGECVPDARNWGSTDPGHPCFPLRPVILAGDLWIDGGVGRGVLVVEGDLRITAGTFEGLIVVRGHLEIDGGTLRGAVRAGSASVTGGTIERDGCAVAAATSAGGLDRGFRPSGRWWIPGF